MQEKTVFTSAARTATANSDDFAFDGIDYAGVLVYLNISAASGTTPTLVVKLQAKDPVSGSYTDIPGAAFASKNTTGADTLTVHPAATASANRVVSHTVPRIMRAVATIGGTTPSFTFTVVAQATN